MLGRPDDTDTDARDADGLPWQPLSVRCDVFVATLRQSFETGVQVVLVPCLCVVRERTRRTTGSCVRRLKRPAPYRSVRHGGLQKGLRYQLVVERQFDPHVVGKPRGYP